MTTRTLKFAMLLVLSALCLFGQGVGFRKTDGSVTVWAGVRLKAELCQTGVGAYAPNENVILVWILDARPEAAVNQYLVRVNYKVDGVKTEAVRTVDRIQGLALLMLSVNASQEVTDLSVSLKARWYSDVGEEQTFTQ